jgi:hypothetical protein
MSLLVIYPPVIVLAAYFIAGAYLIANVSSPRLYGVLALAEVPMVFGPSRGCRMTNSEYSEEDLFRSTSRRSWCSFTPSSEMPIFSIAL